MKTDTITPTEFKDLPETITPEDYGNWRRIGENKAREIFNSKGFPRIKGTGVKQLADKRAVLLYELGLNEKDKQEILKEIARNIIYKLGLTEEEQQVALKEMARNIIYELCLKEEEKQHILKQLAKKIV